MPVIRDFIVGVHSCCQPDIRTISPERAQKEIWRAVSMSRRVGGLPDYLLEMVWYSEAEDAYFVLYKGSFLYGWARKSVIRGMR